MPHAAIEHCNLVFELRAGTALRGGPEATRSPQAIAQALRGDLQEDIEDEAIERAAQVACETGDPAWSRAFFDLMTGDIRKSTGVAGLPAPLRDDVAGGARSMAHRRGSFRLGIGRAVAPAGINVWRTGPRRSKAHVEAMSFNLSMQMGAPVLAHAKPKRLPLGIGGEGDELAAVCAVA